MLKGTVKTFNVTKDFWFA